jgi:hypothetical protein
MSFGEPFPILWDEPWGERITYFEDKGGNAIQITAPIDA